MSRQTWDAHHAGRSLEVLDGGGLWDINSGGHAHFGMTDEIKASA